MFLWKKCFTTIIQGGETGERLYGPNAVHSCSKFDLYDNLLLAGNKAKCEPFYEKWLIHYEYFTFTGVVLETYGNGNIPIKRKEIYKEIERAVKNNVLVVNVTQCVNGTVLGKAIYETGLVSLFTSGNVWFQAR